MIMKKILFFLGLCLSVCCWASGIIDMGGTQAVLDTLEHYQVGPGTYYTHINVIRGSKERHVYMLDVDMTNPYVKLEPVQANDRLGSLETLSSMYHRLDGPNHRMIGGMNGCFFVTNSNIAADPDHYAGMLYQPFQGAAANGVIMIEPNTWNIGWPNEENYEMGFLAVDTANRAYVNCIRWEGQLFAHNDTFPILNVNRPRTYVTEDRIGLFNHYMGSTGTPVNACQEVVFDIDHWGLNQMLHGTVTSVNTTGGTILTMGQAAMQGFQAGRTFLESLQVGDTFSIHLGLLIPDDSIRPQLLEMIGGNAQVMMHGKLLQRNTTEPYNTNDYPRPLIGTNEAGDHVWMIECAKPGMPTKDGCYILQSFGATNVACSDGGGSAQMDLFGENMFATTEGEPRGVGNAIFVVATCDDSDQAGLMQFLDPLSAIPSYASYEPTLRAWTQEGMFISHRYQGHTLSCEPESLGTISEDGHVFTANPIDASGLLIASCGTTQVQTPIEIREGQMRIVYDSIVLGNQDYDIEVEALAGDLRLPMQSQALDWSVVAEDNSVVSVDENGKLHGDHNGKAQVIGTLSDQSDTLYVQVEQAFAPRMSERNDSVCAHMHRFPMDTTFAFSSTRNASVSIPIQMLLYGNPDSVIILAQSTADVQTLELEYHTAQGEVNKYKISGTSPESGAFVFHFDLSKMADITRQGIHPIGIDVAKFAIKDPVKNKSYSLSIEDIILCYRNWKAFTALEWLRAESGMDAVKVIIDGRLYIVRDHHLLDAHGRIVH